MAANDSVASAVDAPIANVMLKVTDCPNAIPGPAVITEKMTVVDE